MVPTDLVRELVDDLVAAAEHMHRVDRPPVSQRDGGWTFEVVLVDRDDLPTGATLTVTVSGA